MRKLTIILSATLIHAGTTFALLERYIHGSKTDPLPEVVGANVALVMSFPVFAPVAFCAEDRGGLCFAALLINSLVWTLALFAVVRLLQRWPLRKSLGDAPQGAAHSTSWFQRTWWRLSVAASHPQTKRITPIAMLTLGLVGGVLLHVPIVSLVDGTYKIRDFQKTPAGFRISPGEAGFIVVNLKQGAHWGMYSASALYADSRNYYVMSMHDDIDHPPYFVEFSYHARNYGHCVNGMTGEIRTLGDWTNAGFLLLTLDDLRKQFPVGTPRDQVMNSIGYGYSHTGLYPDQDSRMYYLQNEGECVILFEEQRLKSVEKSRYLRL